MENEKRLIDAEPIKKFIVDRLNSRNAMEAFGYDAIEILAQIEYAPTVDAVELPCKIGDFVWAIRNYNGHKHPQRGIVSDMYFSNDMRLQVVVKHVARGEWGKTVFATDKEAYAAIEGGKQ